MVSYVTTDPNSGTKWPWAENTIQNQSFIILNGFFSGVCHMTECWSRQAKTNLNFTVLAAGCLSSKGSWTLCRIQRATFSLCPHMVSPLPYHSFCVCVSSFSSYENRGHMCKECPPYRLCCNLNGPISKHGQSLRTSASEFERGMIQLIQNPIPFLHSLLEKCLKVLSSYKSTGYGVDLKKTIDNYCFTRI